MMSDVDKIERYGHLAVEELDMNLDSAKENAVEERLLANVFLDHQMTTWELMQM